MAEKKDKKKDVEGNALTNIFTRKPKTVNLSKETLDKITPVLESMQSSLKDQTASISGLVELAKLTLDSDKDAEERAIRNDLLNQSIEKEREKKGLGIMAGNNTEGSAGDGEGGGSMLGGLLGGIAAIKGAIVAGGVAGAGIGLGAALGGVAAILAGGGYLLKQISEFDGLAVRESIGHLLAIEDDAGGVFAFFQKGGTFALIMGGIGAGLLAFAIGAGSMALVDHFTNGSDWVANLTKNIDNLMNIAKLDSVTTANVTGLMGTLKGLGLALAAFSLPAAFMQIQNNDTWGANLLSNVESILKIGELGSLVDEKNTKKFKDAMGPIGDGLQEFGGFFGLVGAVGMNETGTWGKNLLDNVSALLEIPLLAGATPANGKMFKKVMNDIGNGLRDFGGGNSIRLKNVVELNETGTWGKNLLTNVTSLFKILDLSQVKSGEFEKFDDVMMNLGKGLGSFGRGIHGGFLKSRYEFREGEGSLIKREVEVLLSMLDLDKVKKGDSAQFETLMVGIGNGLSTFGSGKSMMAFANTSEGWWWQDKTFAQGIVDEVGTLMKVTELGNDGSNFKTTMTNISEGLRKFAKSTAFSENSIIMNAVGSIFGVGKSGDEIGRLTKDIGKLDTATDSLNNFTDALLKFSSIKISDKGLINIPDIMSIAATEATVASLGLTENLYNTADAIKKDEPVGVLRISQKSMSIAAAEETKSIASIASSMINQDAKSAKQQQAAANIAVSAPGPVVTTINSPNQQRNTNIFIKTPGSLANGGRPGF